MQPGDKSKAEIKGEESGSRNARITKSAKSLRASLKESLRAGRLRH